MRHIFLLALIGIIGCVSFNERLKNSDEFKVKIVDCETRDECCVYLLEDDSGNKIILFSDKNNRQNNIPFKKYVELLPDTNCQIEVYVDSSKYILPPSGKNTRIRYPYTLYLEDVLFIQNDTVKAQIFRSKKIWDKYLEK